MELDEFPRDGEAEPGVFHIFLAAATYIALYTYGYPNVFELCPPLDPELLVLRFEATPGTAIPVSEQ